MKSEFDKNCESCSELRRPDTQLPQWNASGKGPYLRKTDRPTDWHTKRGVVWSQVSCLLFKCEVISKMRMRKSKIWFDVIWGKLPIIQRGQSFSLAWLPPEHLTRGQNIFADRWAGAYNPHPCPQPPHTHSHAQKITIAATKCAFSLFRCDKALL